MILVFLLSLFIRLWFNFFDNHINTAFACDAAEYLRNAESLRISFKNLFIDHPEYLSTCLKILIGAANSSDIASIKVILSPLSGMSISGPVFPTFLLVCYTVFGQIPSLQAPAIPLIVQSVLSSLTCVLIASIGNICWNKRVGIIAGLLAAFYPGFIIGSGRFYSESFACFFLCLILWLLCRYLINLRHSFLWGFVLGLSLFTLQVTRSLMGILTLIVLFFIAISALVVTERKKEITKYLIAVLLGLFVCILPWLALQKLVLGKASLFVDRCGSYNLCVGNNIDTQGWLSVPYTDNREWENYSSINILRRAIIKSPERWLKLMLDKPARLFKLPWNDFKANIGFISPAAQTIFHQLLLLLACVGLINNESRPEKYKQPKKIARSFIIGTFLLHLAYCAFITVPRYALTAIPEIILFAALGVTVIIKAIRSKQFVFTAISLLLLLAIVMSLTQINVIAGLPIDEQNVYLPQIILCGSTLLKAITICFFFYFCWLLAKKMSPARIQNYISTVTALLILFVLPVYSLPLRAHGRWYEWSQDLDLKGTKIERLLELSKIQKDKLAENGAYLAIYINKGADLVTDYAISINDIKINGPFIPSMAFAQNLSLVHINGDQFVVEQESILKNLCDLRPISLCSLSQWYLIPINHTQWKEIFSHGDKLDIALTKLTDGNSTIYGSYPLSEHFSLVPSLFRYSWEKAFYGVENSQDLCDPTYDQKIALTNKNPSRIFVNLLLPTQKNKMPKLIKTVSAQPYFKDQNVSVFFQPNVQKTTNKESSNCYLVRLLGEMHNTANPQVIPWVIANFSPTLNNKASYNPPWIPLQLNTKQRTAQFDFCFPIALNSFPTDLTSIELNMQKSLKTKDSTQLRCVLQIYQLTESLSGLTYEII